ncbi:MAG: glucosyltransferase domain-containing protein [Acetatifactor sp.]|nr:glucosyltransferase domain-containing protein [Acetatifactor sp.]
MITKRDKISFLSTLVAGIFAYGYILTNNLLTYDSLWNLYSDQNMISSGRPFLMFAAKISSDYDLPWFNGMLAILYLALTAVILCRCFDIKKDMTAVLIGILTVTFPSVANTFVYSFTVDAYMLAVLFSALSVYLTRKYRFGFLAGAMLLAISIGIYQAYFSYAIVLFLLLFIMDLIDNEDFKQEFVLMLKSLFVVVFSYVFYLVSLKVLLSIEGEALSGYQGTDAVFSFGLSTIFTGLKTTFMGFIDFARYANVLTTTWPMKIAFVVTVLLALAELVILFIKSKTYKRALNTCFIILFIALMPFGAGTVSIIAPSTYMHLLIRMPWVLFFVFAAVLAERFEKVQLVTTVSAFVLAFEFALVANVVGYNLNERYEKTYALCNRIIARLETCPDYTPDTKVAILGGYPDTEFYRPTSVTGNDLVGYFGVDGEFVVNSTAKYNEFMSHYMGFSLNLISGEEETALTETAEFKSMDKFPSKDSIGFIGDVLVIKLNG